MPTVLDATVDEPLSDDDTTTTTTATQLDEAPPATGPTSISTSGLVFVGVLVAAARWWFSHDRTAPHLAPDEPAQLAMARFVSGGVRWNMFDHSTWRPGLATLIAPLFWLFDDGETIVRGALVVNAVLAGVAAVFLAKLATRITDLSPRACALVAIVVASSPSALSGSAFVWAESLVTLTFTATTWYVMRFFETDRTRDAVLALTFAVAGFTSHSRLAPMMLVALTAVVGRLARRRQWRRTAAVGGYGVALAGLSYAYAGFLFDRVWDRPASNNTVGTVVHRLDDLDEVLSSTLGQFWYQAVATLGIGLIGGAVIARALVRPTGGVRRTDAWLLVALTSPLIIVSATFMSARTRSDHLVYGRYNDAVLWPVLVIGVAWWVRRARTGFRTPHVAMVVATLLVGGGAAAGVYALRHETLDGDVGVRAMVAGLLPFIGDRDAIPVLRITVMSMVALVLMAAAAWAASRSRALGALTVVLALAALGLGGYRTFHAEGLRLNTWAAAKSVTAIEAILPPGEPVGVSMVPDSKDPSISWERQRQRYQLYQLHLPDHPFLRDRGLDDAVGPYVLAPTGDPTMEDGGAELLWTDPNARIALWKEPPADTTEP